MSIYDFSVTKVNGEKQELSMYKGKVMLILNSAIKCGFTPQYEQLAKMHNDYADKGLVILDFPCNQFGEQAPGTDEEIEAFCVNKYLLPYILCSKTEVNGENEHPLYTYIKSKMGFRGFPKEHQSTEVLEKMLSKNDPNYAELSDIKWNFTKFLVDKDGNVVKRFEPGEDMKIVEEEIVKLL